MSKEKIKKRWLFFGRDKYTYDTIEELIKKGVGLKIGEVVTLNGYYTAGDGANHKRVISNEDDGSGVQLNNGLWANVVHNGTVNVSWFGNESSSFFTYCYNKNTVGIIDKNITINFISKSGSLKGKGNNILTFTSNGQLLFDNNMTIYLSDLILKGTNHSGYFLDFNNVTTYLKNLKFDYDTLNEGAYCNFKNCKFIDIKNQEINNARIGYYFYKNQEIHIDNIDFKEHLTGIWFDCEINTPKEDKNNLIFISNIKGYVANRTFEGATNGKDLILGAGKETYIDNVKAFNNIERAFYLQGNSNVNNITLNTTLKNVGSHLPKQIEEVDFVKSYISDVKVLADKFKNSTGSESVYGSSYFEFYVLDELQLENVSVKGEDVNKNRIAIGIHNTVKKAYISNINIPCKVNTLINFAYFVEYPHLENFNIDDLTLNNIHLQDSACLFRLGNKIPLNINILNSYLNMNAIVHDVYNKPHSGKITFNNCKIYLNNIDIGFKQTSEEFYLNLIDSDLKMNELTNNKNLETLLARTRFFKKIKNSIISMSAKYFNIDLFYNDGSYEGYSSFNLKTNKTEKYTQNFSVRNGIYTFSCGNDLAVYKVLGKSVTKITETELFKQLGADNTVTSTGVGITSYLDKIIELNYTSINID